MSYLKYKYFSLISYQPKNLICVKAEHLKFDEIFLCRLVLRKRSVAMHQMKNGMEVTLLHL